MRKVLIITYYWPPAGGPGVQRWLKFSKFLPENNIQPIILTVDPEYATYPIIDTSLEQEVSNQIKVYRTETKEFFGAYKKATNRKEVPYSGFASEANTISLKEKLARFVRGNFFYPDPRKGWKKFAVAKAEELINSEEIEAIITTGPPHSTHLIGLALKEKLGLPWMADFRDPWTDIYYYRDFYPTPMVRRLESTMEMSVLKDSDLIATASPGFAKMLAGKLGDDSKLLPVTNGFDDDDIQALPLESKDKQLVITYTGTLTTKYPLKTLVDGLQSMPTEVQKKVTLNVVGKLDQGSEELLRSPKGHYHLNLPGYVSHGEVMGFLEQSTHVLLLIPILKGNEGIIPAKLFEYIGSGRQIIGIGPRPSDAAEIIENNNFGKFFTPDQSGDLKDWLIESGNTQSELDSEVRNKFSRRYLTTKLAEAMVTKLLK